MIYKAEKKKKGVLDGSGKGESEEGEFGVVVFGIPVVGLAVFVSGNCNARVLSVSGGDYDGPSIFKKAINFPMIGSVADPVLVLVDDERVKSGEVLKVEPDVAVFPGEDGKDEGERGSEGKKGGREGTYMMLVTLRKSGVRELRSC